MKSDEESIIPVRMIIGRAGSGKSRFVRHDIAINYVSGKNAFLLVPEQQTYECERALMEAMGTGGLWGIEVLSFSRLSKRVLAETGIAWGTHIDHAGLCMALRRVLQECGKSLKAFGEAHKRAGFVEMCLGYVQRCKQYDITSEQLSGAAKTQNPLLRAKLEDFALIQTQLSNFLAERYLDAYDEINECVKQIAYCPSLRGAHVYIDGFERMNAQRYRVIEALMLQAERLTVTFRIDPDPRARDAQVFDIERAAMERIAAIASQHALQVEHVALPQDGVAWGGMRERAAALRHVEKEIFAVPQHVFFGDATPVKLTECASAAEEAHGVAVEMARLARQGVRYREMAVVVSDIEHYAPLLQREMSKLDIPCFVDASRPLAGHALIEMILASLAAADRGYDTNELLRVAKSGFAQVSADETELLENMALRRGLKGRSWTRTLDAPDEALDDARLRLLEPLEALRAQLKTGGAQTCARALIAYLETLRVREKLERRQAQLYAYGQHALAQENAQIWQIILALLDQMVAIWGNAPMPASRFLLLMEAGFAAHRAGAIPSIADEVPISDIERTKAGAVKALFLLGANEAGDIHDALINSRELASMQAQGLNVWPDEQWEAAQQRLLLHGVLSRPTERLYVSYAHMDTQGRMLSPSLLVKQIKGCLADIQPLLYKEAMYTSAQAMEILADLLCRGEHADRCQQIFGYLWQNGWQSTLGLLTRLLGASPEDAHILPETAVRLYGKNMVTTASRIEQFYRCPFAHMATYGIRAKERKQRTATLPDAGMLLHKALEEALRKAMAANLDWRMLNQEDIDALLDSVWDELAGTFENGLWRSSGRLRAQAERLKRVARRSLTAVAAQYAQSDFKPAGVEMVFGPGQPLPAYPVSKDVLLSGKIDRMDIMETYARIVDYKLGDPKLRYADILAGNKLQLLLYMSAAMHFANTSNAEPYKPAGMFFMGLQDPLQDEDDTVSALRLRGLLTDDALLMQAMDHDTAKHSGVIHVQRTAGGAPYGEQVLTPEQMQQTIDYAKTQVLRAAERMRGGAAEALPLQQGSALICENCIYQCACGFDPNAPGAKVRKISVRKRDFLEQAGGEPYTVDA